VNFLSISYELLKKHMAISAWHFGEIFSSFNFTFPSPLPSTESDDEAPSFWDVDK